MCTGRILMQHPFALISEMLSLIEFPKPTTSSALDNNTNTCIDTALGLIQGEVAKRIRLVHSCSEMYWKTISSANPPRRPQRERGVAMLGNGDLSGSREGVTCWCIYGSLICQVIQCEPMLHLLVRQVVSLLQLPIDCLNLPSAKRQCSGDWSSGASEIIASSGSVPQTIAYLPQMS